MAALPPPTPAWSLRPSACRTAVLALALGLVACHGGKDPWLSPESMAGSSPLDLVLDMSREPEGPTYETVLCVSDKPWDAHLQCRVIAHSISTLDLFVADEGVLLLFGISLHDLGMYRLGASHAYALTTSDLEHFGTRAWAIDQTISPLLTDTAMERLPDGSLRVIYASGPAHAKGDHYIMGALRQENHWVEHQRPIFAGPSLVDPSACSFDGTHHIFATAFERTGIMHGVGETPWYYERDEGFEWFGAQVPYCFVDEGKLKVVAQLGGGWAPPEVRTLQSDGSFSPGVPLWTPHAIPALESCTAPVLGRFAGKYLLFCAVHHGCG